MTDDKAQNLRCDDNVTRKVDYQKMVDAQEKNAVNKTVALMFDKKYDLVDMPNDDYYNVMRGAITRE